MADRIGFLTIGALQYEKLAEGAESGHRYPELDEPGARSPRSPQHSAGDNRCAVRRPVNREHLYPDAAPWGDGFLTERVLVEQQRHQLWASVTASSAPAILTTLVLPV